MNIKENNSGAIGIGAMIVFIAMVLVAGIAASVLIQTSNTLEMQALKSGSETIAEVSTGIQVEGIEGWNQSGAIKLMAIEVRPRAGSDDIDLDETVVEISDSSTKNLFVYVNGNTTVSPFKDTGDTNGDIFARGNYPHNNGTTFGVIVLEDADSSCAATTPIINAGDHVVLTVNVTAAFADFTNRVDVFGMVIPEEGSPGIISFTTPATFLYDVVDLQ